MSDKIKIIFISHNFHFLNNIIDNLNRDKYEVTIHELLKSDLRIIQLEEQKNYIEKI